MANVDSPAGLVPIGYLNGAPYNGQCRPYVHAAGDAVPLFIGSPVTQSGATNAAAVGSYKIGELETVKLIGAAGNTPPITGVVVAVSPLQGAGASGRDSEVYCPASTERVVWVADDPMIIFRIQEDDDTAAIALTDTGNNFDLIATSAGSTVTGLCGWELDSSSAAVTATGDVQVLNISRIPDNDFGGGHVKWDVRINLHRFNTGTLGVA